MLRYLFQFTDNPWANGLRLALLNVALASFYIVTFLGTLFAVVSLSRWRFASSGDPSASVPFPYPSLLLLYVLIVVFAWLWCGRRLPASRKARLQAASIGALPLFALGLLGYLDVGSMFLLGDVTTENMLDASIFIYGAIATLILLAGFACVGLIVFSGRAGNDISKPT